LAGDAAGLGAAEAAQGLRIGRKKGIMTVRGEPLGEAQNIPAGIGLMALGFFLFSLNDALGKYLAGTYSPGQILLFRSMFALAILAPFVMRVGYRTLFTLEQPGLQAFRLACATIDTFLFYWAVSVLPLADAMTYYLAGPIYVTVMAALFLGETVRWRRWLAVLAGFVGVVVALQPSTASFGWYALLALAGSIMYAVFVVTTRSLRRTPDVSLAFWQFAVALVVGAITAPLDWVRPTGEDIALIGLLGVLALAAILCVNRSLKMAPASIVVPYQNTLIVWAVILGYIFFGDVPAPSLLIGAAIIILAGLYIFFRERKVADRG
jgi:drug/metabolite transporter (DMT)-like permease